MYGYWEQLKSKVYLSLKLLDGTRLLYGCDHKFEIGSIINSKHQQACNSTEQIELYCWHKKRGSELLKWTDKKNRPSSYPRFKMRVGN